MVFATPSLRCFCGSLILVGGILLCSLQAYGESPQPRPLRRTGYVIGLDPGVAVRFTTQGTPLYARMNLRIGGCFNKHVQLGADLRMDFYVDGESGDSRDRRVLGPVATFYLTAGWFVRTYAHVGAIEPFMVTVGVGTGYEWGLTRFSAVGLTLGGDSDVLFNGPPSGYSMFLSAYLSAYDLATRRGRE